MQICVFKKHFCAVTPGGWGWGGCGGGGRSLVRCCWTFWMDVFIGLDEGRGFCSVLFCSSQTTFPRGLPVCEDQGFGFGFVVENQSNAKCFFTLI